MEKIEENCEIIDGIFEQISSASGGYVRYYIGEEEILLDGIFTIEELRYFIEVMQGKR